MTSNYEAALAWRSKGYNVVPQKAPDKKYPGVKWKDLQNRLATQGELASWERLFSNGVGFITGAPSGVIVIEGDGPEGEALLAEFEKLHGSLPETLTIRSGSGRGFHRHFRHPGYHVTTQANPSIKLDVKGDGGFCVLPPSRHKSGGRYAIVHNSKPAKIPQGLLEFIVAKARGAKGDASRKTNETSSFGDAPKHAHDDELGSNTTRADFAPPPAKTTRAMLEFLKAKNFFGNCPGWANGSREA